MSPEAEAARTDESSLQGAGVGEKHTGPGKNNETSNTGPTSSTNSAQTSQTQAAEASSEGTKPSGDAPVDIAHSREEQDAEEDEDENAPQFTWGAPRGRLAPPVKGKPTHPR